MLMGIFFGAGWSPCIGVTLGAILTLALDQATVGRGSLLLLTYSLGLGIPFLVLAAGVGRGARKLRATAKTTRVVSIVSGAFLVVLGVLVLTNSLSWLSQWSPAFDIGPTG
jgi:cytochrome c-type biogenesis protein